MENVSSRTPKGDPVVTLIVNVILGVTVLLGATAITVAFTAIQAILS